ncbi:hypothetical protein MPSEU_000647700 [Mayamaea pseudoterrestris]|nr:hypothetical protein MPSEU_000647700 [Mayamaea pseudoterrestris]
MAVTEQQDEQKIIIFDWDDTICPSSFVDRCNIDHVSELPVPFQHVFIEIAKAAEACLHEASKHGQVIIITNSDDGWVNYSCERYLPQLLPIMEKYRIVSARTGYERFYPSQPLCWKAAAFAHEVNEYFDSCAVDDDGTTSLESTDVSSDDSSTEFEAPSQSLYLKQPSTRPVSSTKQIISFGDSTEERTAVRIVSEQLGAMPKSVMFVQTPTPSQLVGQLVMLTEHMQFVCESQSILDLEINAEQAEQCAVAYLEKENIHLNERQLTERLERMVCCDSTDISDDDMRS